MSDKMPAGMPKELAGEMPSGGHGVSADMIGTRQDRKSNALPSKMSDRATTVLNPRRPLLKRQNAVKNATGPMGKAYWWMRHVRQKAKNRRNGLRIPKHLIWEEDNPDYALHNLESWP